MQWHNAKAHAEKENLFVGNIFKKLQIEITGNGSNMIEYVGGELTVFLI